MAMSRHQCFGTIALLLVISSRGTAQNASPSPALPAINPLQARLDQTISNLDGPGSALAYSNSLGILTAACERGTLQSWDKAVLLGVRVGEKTPNIISAHTGPITAMAWNGGPVLASAGFDRTLILRSMPDGKVLHTIKLEPTVRALTMSPDGKLLACGLDDNTVTLVNVTDGQSVAKLAGHSDWIGAVAFSADGKVLASGGYDESLRLWDVPARKQIAEIAVKTPPPPNAPPPPRNQVHALAFSPDGKTIAVGGSDALIQIIDIPTAKIVRTLSGHTGAITSLGFHPSGTMLYSGSKDRTIRLWNPSDGKMLKSLEGHTAWVQGVTLLTDGTRLASVSADQTVRIWDLTEPAKK